MMVPQVYVSALSLCCSVASLYIVHQSATVLNENSAKSLVGC